MQQLPAFDSPVRRAVRALALTGFATIAALTAATPARADEAGGWLHSVADSVRGSGVVVTESRPIGGFRAITLRNSMKLVLRQGLREGVELTGDDNVLARIETVVVDRNGLPTLEIGTRRDTRIRTRGDLSATIDLKTLEALTIQGSGEVSAEQLKTGALKLLISGSGDLRLARLEAGDVALRLSGSGDATLSGKAAKVGVSLAGSGDVDTIGLEADTVTVSIAGSGDAKVNAHKSLTVSIAGSGDVVYTGEAAVKTSIAGNGTVKKR